MAPVNPDPKELFENGHRVKFYIDQDLRTADRISFHPCDNTASVVIGRDDFLRFLMLWGGEYEWLDCNPANDKASPSCLILDD